MRKFLMAILAMCIVTGVMAGAALAWPNTVTGTVTGTPACNKATGQFEGSFSVSWTVTSNVDQGYELTDVSPASPASETYGLGDAGQSKSFTFTLTQTKYIVVNGHKYKVKEQTANFTGSIALPGLGDCVKGVPPTIVEPPKHDCVYTGAGKGGQLDIYGGQNDDCAPIPVPPVFSKPPTYDNGPSIVSVDRFNTITVKVKVPVIKWKTKTKKVTITKIKIKKIFVTTKPDKPHIVCGKGTKLYRGHCAVMGSG